MLIMNQTKSALLEITKEVSRETDLALDTQSNYHLGRLHGLNVGLRLLEKVAQDQLRPAVRWLAEEMELRLDRFAYKKDLPRPTCAECIDKINKHLESIVVCLALPAGGLGVNT